MKWNQAVDKKGNVQKYGMVSDCGKYRIAKAFVQGVADYMVWFEWECLGHFPTSKEAGATASAHQAEAKLNKAPPGVVEKAEWFCEG